MYNNNQDESTSKRISFQSIFSSLCTLHQGGKYDFSQLEDLAHAINKRLHETYPTEVSNLPDQKTMNEQAKYNNYPESNSFGKQKPTKCPQCGRFTLYKNKGISKKSGAPYENVKCANKECGFIEWKTMNYDQHKAKDLELKNMRQQNDIDNIEEENYNAEEDTREYGV